MKCDIEPLEANASGLFVSSARGGTVFSGPGARKGSAEPGGFSIQRLTLAIHDKIS